jgi:predicted AAA+ superfamily ATPase
LILKNDPNNKILKEAKKITVKVSVAEIEKSYKRNKGNISSFLNNKKPVSDISFKHLAKQN